MKLNCVGLTDIGAHAQQNEDAFLISEGEEVLCIIANGQAGSTLPSPDFPATMAIKSIDTFVRAPNKTQDITEKDTDAHDRSAFLIGGIEVANKAIFEMGEIDEAHETLCASIVTCLFSDGSIHIAHVGNCRAYRFRDKKLERQTEDHTLTNQLIKEGSLSTKKEIEDFAYGNILTKTCGMEEDIEVETSCHEIQAGDLYLLCSDGLNEMVSDEDLSQMIGQHDGDLESLCQLLIDRANEEGGFDNITVILAQVV